MSPHVFLEFVARRVALPQQAPSGRLATWPRDKFAWVLISPSQKTTMISNAATRHTRVQKTQAVQTRGGRPPPRRTSDGRRKSHRHLNHDTRRDLTRLAPKRESIPGPHEQDQAAVHATISWHRDLCNCTPTLALPEPMATPEAQLNTEGSCVEQLVPALQPEIQSPLPLDHPDGQDKRTLACPYYKRHPQKYRDCRGYILSRHKDVTQHIRRKHVVHLFCTRCYDLFESSSSLRAHERDFPPCATRLRAGIVSRYSLDMFIKTREHDSSRGTSAQDQWIELWCFLFPEVEPPASVYVESHEEEIASHLYSFWEKNHRRIAYQLTLSCGIVPGSTQEGISVQVFDVFLRELLEQFLESGGKNWRISPRAAMEITTQPPNFGLESTQLECPDSWASESAFEEAIFTGFTGERHDQHLFADSYSTSSDGTDTTQEDPLCAAFAKNDGDLFDPLRTVDPSDLVVSNLLLYKDDLPAPPHCSFPDFIGLTNVD